MAERPPLPMPLASSAESTLPSQSPLSVGGRGRRLAAQSSCDDGEWNGEWVVPSPASTPAHSSDVEGEVSESIYKEPTPKHMQSRLPRATRPMASAAAAPFVSEATAEARAEGDDNEPPELTAIPAFQLTIGSSHCEASGSGPASVAPDIDTVLGPTVKPNTTSIRLVGSGCLQLTVVTTSETGPVMMTVACSKNDHLTSTVTVDVLGMTIAAKIIVPARAFADKPNEAYRTNEGKPPWSLPSWCGCEVLLTLANGLMLTVGILAGYILTL
ncbi:hypothetical protein T492DRAFT_1122318 [Pavlovales sp. CCMP2436]|nr:hypothetical protein T492DRAFT_1122318 [Pavlovales sp. CCMP2436]